MESGDQVEDGSQPPTQEGVSSSRRHPHLGKLIPGTSGSGETRRYRDQRKRERTRTRSPRRDPKIRGKAKARPNRSPGMGTTGLGGPSPARRGQARMCAS